MMRDRGISFCPLVRQLRFVENMDQLVRWHFVENTERLVRRHFVENTEQLVRRRFMENMDQLKRWNRYVVKNLHR